MISNVVAPYKVFLKDQLNKHALALHHLYQMVIPILTDIQFDDLSLNIFQCRFGIYLKLLS